ALVAMLAALSFSSKAQAWGCRHVGYTHFGPTGVHHAGYTAHYGGGGYGGSAHYGSAGGGYHYGGSSHYGAAGGGVYRYGGYHYGSTGGSSYHYGYHYHY